MPDLYTSLLLHGATAPTLVAILLLLGLLVGLALALSIWFLLESYSSRVRHRHAVRRQRNRRRAARRAWAAKANLVRQTASRSLVARSSQESADTSAFHSLQELSVS